MKDAELVLEPLTVIVGANGSGKTALWEALGTILGWPNDPKFGTQVSRKLDDLSGSELNAEIDWDNGLQVSLKFKKFKNVGSIPAEGNLKTEGETQFSFKLVSKRSNEAEYEVHFGPRRFRHIVLLPFPIFKIFKDAASIFWFFNPLTPEIVKAKESPNSIERPLEKAHMFLSSYRAHFHFFDINALETATEIDEDRLAARLNVDGSNLPVVLSMARNKGGLFREIEDLFKYITGAEELNLKEDYKAKVVLTTMSENGQEIPLSEWPSGYKKILLLITALRTVPRGSTVFIEEPETHLHPGMLIMLRELVDSALRRGVQVIFTTHSPALVKRLCPHKEDWKRVIIAEEGTFRKASEIDWLKEVKVSLGELLEEDELGYHEE